MRAFARIVAFSLLSLIGLVAILVVFSAIRFYSPDGATRPCQGCSGDATAVHVNGFDLYYREVGSSSSSPPVVVLHGGPGHSSDSFHESLDFLGETYRVVYYDQRGSGHSQIKPDPSLYTIDQLIAELETLRQDVIQADRIVLVAHSAGGAIAQRYVLSHPDRVSRLVLISSVPANNGVAAPFLWDAFGPALFALGLGFPPSDPLEANDWFTHAMVETSAPRLFDPANRALIEDSGTVSFVTWREVSRSLEGDDRRDSLALLQVPTLVLYGVADGSSSGFAVASSLCETIPRCQLVGFERSGHWPFLEQPEEFARVLTAFLANP